MLGPATRFLPGLWISCLLLRFPAVYGWNRSDEVKSMEFLAKFGYISNEAMEEGEMVSREVVDGLRMFQEYGGVNVTGRLDRATMGLMAQPRCGNTDLPVVLRMKSGRRNKRFLLNSKWEKRSLSYKILNYPGCCLSTQTVDRETDQAFRLWTRLVHPHLQIQRKAAHEVVDIDIKFTTGPHNDNMRFGRTGTGDRTVAHAFYPQQEDDHHIRGDIHFFADESWTSGVEEGQNYFQTLLHEIGHSLGLDHSMDHSAVMYPLVPSFQPNFRLGSDDVQGIQFLYGHPSTSTQTREEEEEEEFSGGSHAEDQRDPADVRHVLSSGRLLRLGGSAGRSGAGLSPETPPQSRAPHLGLSDSSGRKVGWLCMVEKLRAWTSEWTSVNLRSLCYLPLGHD